MTMKQQIYHCKACGNIVSILHSGAGRLRCCDKPMVLLNENDSDASVEKHIPVITSIDGGFKVSVGSTAHPMDHSHHIEWIELIVDDMHYLHYLKQNQEPSTVFAVEGNDVRARCYCNLHGLWGGKR